MTNPAQIHRTPTRHLRGAFECKSQNAEFEIWPPSSDWGLDPISSGVSTLYKLSHSSASSQIRSACARPFPKLALADLAHSHP